MTAGGAQDAVSAWWRAWAEQAAACARSAATGPGADPLHAATEAYRQFGELLARQLAGVPPAAQAATLAAAFERLAGTPHAAHEHAWLSLPSLWVASLLDGALAGAWRDVARTARAWSDEYAALPAVGPGRDWASAAQGVLRALNAEQQAREDFAAQQSAAPALALRRFAAFLRDAEGAPLDSLRAVYSAWIRIADEAHRETMMSPAYGRALGHWVNTANAARLAVVAWQERLAEAGDLPHQGTVAVLLERQRALEDELETLRVRLAELAEGTRGHAVPAVAPMAAVGPSGPAPVAPRTARRAAEPRASAIKPASKKQPTRRVRAPRERPPAVGEFDIGQILDEAD